MIEAIKFLGGAQLGTSESTLYEAPTAPPNAKVKITSIWVVNTTGSIRAVTLRFGTGTLDATHNLLGASAMEPNKTWIIRDSLGVIVLDAGMKVTAFCSAATAVNVFLFGAELS